MEQASNNSPPLSDDPQNNVVAAIIRWVEEDVAPDSLTAVYYNDNDAANGIGFTLPLCRVSATIYPDQCGSPTYTIRSILTASSTRAEIPILPLALNAC